MRVLSDARWRDCVRAAGAPDLWLTSVGAAEAAEAAGFRSRRLGRWSCAQSGACGLRVTTSCSHRQASQSPFQRRH